ncbi:Spo0B domain-containing protein [Streptococcus pluranimalium]|uniref:Spo0B domain-containing protein n=1 Tax=Streptococcus pluranimalium TaxID=82348 RepID=UPI0039FB9B78
MNRIRESWENARIFTKILLSISFVIVFIALSLYGMFNWYLYQQLDNEYRVRLTQIGETIANNEHVVYSLQQEESTERLVTYASRVEAVNDLDYVVLFTPDLTRLTHPNKALIGLSYIGDNDYHDALAGKVSTNIGSGTMGRSIRAYIPVFEPGTQDVIGVVSLGTMIDTYYRHIVESVIILTIMVLLAITLGIGISYFVSRALKKQMFDMEPREIARHLQERNAMLENSFEGMIATSEDQTVTLRNRYVKETISIEKSEVLSVALPKLSQSDYGTSIQELNHTRWLVSKSPIIVKEENVGDFYIIKNVEEIEQTMRSMDATARYAQIIREYHHDYLNKLHAIYGLSELENYKELKRYLSQLLANETSEVNKILLLINNVAIAGTLMDMAERLKQKDIAFQLIVSGEISDRMSIDNTVLWNKTLYIITNFICSQPVTRVKATLYEKHDQLLIDLMTDCVFESRLQATGVKIVKNEIRYTQTYKEASDE